MRPRPAIKRKFSPSTLKSMQNVLWECMDSLKYERSRSSSVIFSIVSKRRILHQTSDTYPIKLSFDLQADIHENKLHDGFCKQKAQELRGYKRNNASCCLPAPITSWVTYALRRPVVHFCYNFYRKQSQLGKSSFQVTVCSSRNRSTACHSTSSVCVVGSAALLPNNSKDQWRSLNVHVSTGRCHPLKTRHPGSLYRVARRAGFFPVFGKLDQVVLYRSCSFISLSQTPSS